MTNLDVTFSNNDILVVGPPSQLNVDLDIGPKGQRGSQIFFGQEKPTTFTQFPEDAPLPYDLYFNLGPLDDEYLSVYQYNSIPAIGLTWVKLFKIFPNELRKNYSFEFTNGQAIKTINIAADILPLNLIGSLPEASNFNIVYTIENDKPVSAATEIQVGINPLTGYLELTLTLNAIEYNSGTWQNLVGTRTVHLDIRVV